VARLISAQELAELVPCPPGHVERLVELGLITTDEDGLHHSSDVQVLRLMAAFEEAGIPLDDVARGVAAGDLSYPLGLFMPEPVKLTSTYEELASGLGRSPELLRRLSRELGFPAPADDRIRAEDAEMLSLLVTTLDLVDDDELSRFARLYGGSVQRLVIAGIEFFERAVRPRVVAANRNLSTKEQDTAVYERGGAFSELARTLVPWLQSRHRERGLIEYLVGLTEGWLEERGIAPRPAKQPPAIAFLDLTGYTALAEERGDEAAAAVAAELADVVQQGARAHGGRPVKWLGDGVMFHFDDPGRAIRSGLELVEQTESAISVPARMGINAGAVIVQEGDYFGRTVNVAARIADFARPREVLVSDEAKRAADDSVSFELVGDVPLRGVSRPVRLHRAVRGSSR
jgi:adenylate cyclase